MTGDSHGVEVTVKLDSGKVLAIPQDGNETFNPGDRVKVLTFLSGQRVTHTSIPATALAQ